mgnify:FL=1
MDAGRDNEVRHAGAALNFSVDQAIPSKIILANSGAVPPILIGVGDTHKPKMGEVEAGSNNT